MIGQGLERCPTAKMQTLQTKICTIYFYTRQYKTDEPPHDKTNKMTVRPAKTQISLGICPVAELLMPSRGHFLLIMIVIYQNVCLDVWIAKMVPANFFCHLSRSRSKIKGQNFKIQRANDYVMIYGQHYVNIWSYPCNIERKYFIALQNETYKWPWESISKGQGHLIEILQKNVHRL